MKKLNFYLLALIAMLPLLHSCNQEGTDNNYPEYQAWTTLHVNSIEDYYFVADTGEKIFPGDVSKLSIPYSPFDNGVSKNGDRTIIYFNALPTTMPEFDYNAQLLLSVTDVPSSDVEVISDKASYDKLAEGIITIQDAQSAGNWVDFICQVNPGKKHEISLISPEFDLDPSIIPQDIPLGYKYIEIRLKEVEGTSNNNQILHSFRLNTIKPSTPEEKGFYIRYRTSNSDGGFRYKKVDFLRVKE